MRCTKLTYHSDFEVLKGGFAKRLTPEKSVLNACRCSYYILDATGNLLNVMEHTVVDENTEFTLKERHIYGSSSLGLNKHEVDLLSTTSTTTIDGILGEKFYNLSNHLGNVLTTISDIKVPESLDSITVTSYRATIVNTYDYSPFGVMLDGRTQENEFVRSGFNGMERDDEMKGMGNSYDFGARIFDPRLGRWLTRDPHYRNYPDISPYTFVNNMPIWSIDPDGKDIIVLSAPSGANGLGHAAVLIGNDKDGWRYYSKNGTEEHGKKGPSHDPNKGDKFASVQDFASSEFNFVDGQQYYTSAFRISSNTEVDKKMEQAALEAVNSDYDLYNASCIDVAADALNAGGFYGGFCGRDPNEVSIVESINNIPNVKYREMMRANKRLYKAQSVNINPSIEVSVLEQQANLPDFEYKIVDNGVKYHSNNSDKTRVYVPQMIEIDNRTTKKIAKEKLDKIRNSNEQK